ncbi:hypothetical protein [uncultured Cohaesibacter sp.]|uniref:hypothetical protein n=1 Tax=uncultured Cohaesibacter sp. TaxID=1002546 RepID=UPI00292FBD3A|nr:hypothetical protein [uncultured Cohaesibacter sp.]
MLQTNILFLDETNNDRSILAEAYYNHGLKNVARASSAGFEPAEQLDRHLYDLLKADGVCPDDYCPKPVDIFLQAYSPRIDLIVAFKPLRGAFKLPIFPNHPAVLHLSVEDSRGRVSEGGIKRAVRSCYADLKLSIDRAVASGKLPGAIAA